MLLENEVRRNRFVFWIGAVVEAVLARGTPKDTAVRIATAFVAMVMGFVLEMALMLSTMDA